MQRLEVGKYQQGADEIRTAPSQDLTGTLYPLLTPLVVSRRNKQVHVTPRTGDFKDEEHFDIQTDQTYRECGYGRGHAGRAGYGKTLDYTTKLTITQDQVNQAFSNGPLQAPTSNTMPLWQIILVALAALIILLMGGKKVYDLISARRRKQAKGSNQSMDISNRRDQVLK